MHISLCNGKNARSLYLRLTVFIEPFSMAVSKRKICSHLKELKTFHNSTGKYQSLIGKNLKSAVNQEPTLAFQRVHITIKRTFSSTAAAYNNKYSKPKTYSNMIFFCLLFK